MIPKKKVAAIHKAIEEGRLNQEHRKEYTARIARLEFLKRHAGRAALQLEVALAVYPAFEARLKANPTLSRDQAWRESLEAVLRERYETDDVSDLSTMTVPGHYSYDHAPRNRYAGLELPLYELLMSEYRGLMSVEFSKLPKDTAIAAQNPLLLQKAK